MKLLSSYKNVIKFLKLKSYLDILGEKLSKGTILLIIVPTTFSIYVLYKTYFYLLNLLKVS